MEVSRLEIPEVNPGYIVVWSREPFCEGIELDKLPIPTQDSVRRLWDEIDSSAIGCRSIDLTCTRGAVLNGLLKLHLQPRAVRYWIDIYNLVGVGSPKPLASYMGAARWLWNELSYKDEANR